MSGEEIMVATRGYGRTTLTMNEVERGIVIHTNAEQNIYKITDEVSGLSDGIFQTPPTRKERRKKERDSKKLK